MNRSLNSNLRKAIDKLPATDTLTFLVSAMLPMSKQQEPGRFPDGRPSSPHISGPATRAVRLTTQEHALEHIISVYDQVLYGGHHVQCDDYNHRDGDC